MFQKKRTKLLLTYYFIKVKSVSSSVPGETVSLRLNLSKNSPKNASRSGIFERKNLLRIFVLYTHFVFLLNYQRSILFHLSLNIFSINISWHLPNTSKFPVIVLNYTHFLLITLKYLNILLFLYQSLTVLTISFVLKAFWFLWHALFYVINSSCAYFLLDIFLVYLIFVGFFFL